MNNDKYGRLGRKIKRILADFYLHQFHAIFTIFALISLVGFFYTGVRGLVYMYAPIEDAYYAQYYKEFQTNLSAKNYLRQFLPMPALSILVTMPANSDIEFFDKSKFANDQIKHWELGGNLSKSLFGNRFNLTHEQYIHQEEVAKNALVWNKNYDGHSNPYLPAEMQERYDVKKMIDKLYGQFSKDTDMSINFLGKNAEKWLPLNTVVYKRLMSNKVGLPATWFYRNLDKNLKEIEIKLEEQSRKKEQRFRSSYRYLISSGFFMGCFIAYALYFFQRSLKNARNHRSNG